MTTRSAHAEPIRTRYRPIRSVSVTGIRQMYEVFAACHDEAALDVFIRELGRKTGVILMTRTSDDRVVGFATVTLRRTDLGGSPALAMLADDAVVLPDYWAQSELIEAIQSVLLKIKLRHPGTPLYWCQLARHHRSFHLMAGHAHKVYPSADGLDADHKRIAQALGKQLFKQGFDARRMLLTLTGEHIFRPHAADMEISRAMTSADRHIALFSKMNPNWRKGTALLSVSAFDTTEVLQALQAAPLRWIRRHILRNYLPAGAGDAARSDSQQQASWQDSSLDDALERGKTS